MCGRNYYCENFGNLLSQSSEGMKGILNGNSTVTSYLQCKYLIKLGVFTQKGMLQRETSSPLKE